MQARAITALFAVALGISSCAYYDDYRDGRAASHPIAAAPHAGLAS
ncbi:MAG TPA: hypothetical protein VGD19_10285 [Allosphingosinicella sp.]|jgi:hypothetical protein